jgi:predicted transcriptional regulator
MTSTDTKKPQYNLCAQYIGELHANGLLENATLEKVTTISTTDLGLAPVQL